MKQILVEKKPNHKLFSDVLFSKKEFEMFCKKNNISEDKIKEVVVIWEEQIYKE